MNENEKQLLIELATRMGTTIEHLIGVLIRQAYVDGIMDLAGGAICMITWCLGLRAIWRGFRGIKSPDESDIFLFGLGSATVLLLVFIPLRMMSDGLSDLINPEFWAIKFVVENIN